MTQQKLTHFGFPVVSLPKKRSKVSLDKPFWKKALSPAQEILLKIHDMTNWSKIELFQDYKTPKGINKKILWKLPSTKDKKNTCGIFKTSGCFNLEEHPNNQAFISHTKMGCFRSSCEYCWLEKWLARESSRSTQRIENYQKVVKSIGKTRFTEPVHVIVSPGWNDKFMRFDLLKNKCRKLLDEAGLEGGLMIYHPFSLNKKTMTWIKRPHFHVVGFGWIHGDHVKKISDEENWVIKNKGVRESLHATVYYQLSHAGVADNIHSITWFGDLGYRSKYAQLIKVENEENNDNCDFCGELCVNATFNATDRGPPDFEFIGLVDPVDWKPTETVEESMDRQRSAKKSRTPKPIGYLTLEEMSFERWTTLKDSYR